jgi:hypothetical protein
MDQELLKQCSREHVVEIVRNSQLETEAAQREAEAARRAATAAGELPVTDPSLWAVHTKLLAE